MLSTTVGDRRERERGATAKKETRVCSEEREGLWRATAWHTFAQRPRAINNPKRRIKGSTRGSSLDRNEFALRRDQREERRQGEGRRLQKTLGSEVPRMAGEEEGAPRTCSPNGPHIRR